MILAAASPLGLMLTVMAALAYAIPALAARALNMITARRVLLVAWILHAGQIAWALLSDTSYFGFAQALSVTVWLALAMYLLETRRHEHTSGHWALATCGAATVVLAAIFPGTALPETSSPLLALHWALGMAAYGLFAAAVAHGWLMTRTERHMRSIDTEVPGGLPLMKQERLMFRFIWTGFVLLTLTLVAGLFFGEQLYGPQYTGWRWDHKRVFTALSWLVFAALLAGRVCWGWRGRRAAHMLYVGAAFLLLGYAGSRFVLEVLLHRAP